MAKYDRDILHTETFKLFGANLTDNGVQYTAAGTAAGQDTYGTAYWGTINPKVGGSVLWYEFGLTYGIKGATSATADIKVQWRGRDKGTGSWVNLHSATAWLDVGTTEIPNTISGYYGAEANFNRLPCELQMLVQATESAEGVARVKNSSYIRPIWQTIGATVTA